MDRFGLFLPHHISKFESITNHTSAINNRNFNIHNNHDKFRLRITMVMLEVRLRGTQLAPIAKNSNPWKFYTLAISFNSYEMVFSLQPINIITKKLVKRLFVIINILENSKNFVQFLGVVIIVLPYERFETVA